MKANEPPANHFIELWEFLTSKEHRRGGQAKVEVCCCWLGKQELVGTYKIRELLLSFNDFSTIIDFMLPLNTVHPPMIAAAISNNKTSCPAPYSPI